MQLNCTLCDFTSKSLISFCQHYEIHRNVANFQFPCGVSNCFRSFKNYTAFKSHIFRDHGNRNLKKVTQLQLEQINLSCNVSLCGFQCVAFEPLIVHLKQHILDNISVLCPFKECGKYFSVKSSFSSHISRSHRDKNIKLLSECIAKSVPMEISHDDILENGDELNVNDNMDVSEDDSSAKPYTVNSSKYLDSLALFYLKLQAKLLLPASTIQTIVEEMKTIHNLGQSLQFQQLSAVLSRFNVSVPDIESIVSDLRESDIFHVHHEGPLRSDFSRQTFFKQRFNLVSPISLYLGQDRCDRARFVQYIPIKDTIKSIFEDKRACEMYREMHAKKSDSGILRDVSDGKAFKSNSFFTQNPGALRIILYQDAFEVANPLGSGKKKHKVLAVYFSLGDLLPHTRSAIDQIQLVLLVREVDFKYFGQEAVFSKLVEDLTDIEDNGITLFGDETVLGTVVAMVGDNLGSHCIGGFTENFSTSNYVCRYCTLDRDRLKTECHISGDLRTIEHYDDIVANIESNVEHENFGIKFRSIFNKLKYFHVCQPGLPPCIGHDLFEGFASRDVALFLHYFIKTKKLFTYDQLNRIINKFKYIGADADSKPCDLKDNAEKLSGHAVQNWCFIRLLPILIGDRILDKNDSVWCLMLLLRNIVELVCAPSISENQVAWLQELIRDYLQQRCELFPDHPVTPKHHFLAHYSQLIIQFGPLIRVWTLRFESKHSYFKNAARKLRNFKNLCQTLADRHQLLQAYLGAGSLFPAQIVAEGTSEFFIQTYNCNIQNAVNLLSIPLSNALVVAKVVYKGTLYQCLFQMLIFTCCFAPFHSYTVE